MVTKVKNSNCDKTQKLKLWQQSNWDKTQNVTKLKLWQNFKTQIVTKLKTQIVTKLKKLKFYQNQKIKLWQNLKTQIVIVVIVTVVTVIVRVISFSKNNVTTCHLDISLMCSGQFFAILWCFGQSNCFWNCCQHFSI